MELLKAQGRQEEAIGEDEEGSSLVLNHYKAYGTIQLWKGDQGLDGSQKLGQVHLQRLYGQSCRVCK